MALCLLLPGLWVPALLFPWCWLPSCSGSGVLGFVGAMQMQPSEGGGRSLTQEASRVKELWLFWRNSGALLDYSFCFFLLFVVEFCPPYLCSLVGADKRQVIYN